MVIIEYFIYLSILIFQVKAGGILSGKLTTSYNGNGDLSKI